MMYLLKAAAAILAFFAARTVVTEYKKYSEKRILVFEGFLSLLSFIKNELSCRARALTEWTSEFQNDALYEIGFIDALREKGSLSSALLSVKEKNPSLAGEGIKLLDGYFASFGKSYRNAEEGEACRAFDELSHILERERAESARSIKVVRVVSYAIAAGAVILML